MIFETIYNESLKENMFGDLEDDHVCLDCGSPDIMDGDDLCDACAAKRENSFFDNAKKLADKFKEICPDLTDEQAFNLGKAVDNPGGDPKYIEMNYNDMIETYTNALTNVEKSELKKVMKELGPSYKLRGDHSSLFESIYREANELQKPDLLTRMFTTPGAPHNEDGLYTVGINTELDRYIDECNAEGQDPKETAEQILSHKYWKKMIKNNDNDYDDTFKELKTYINRRKYRDSKDKYHINGSGTQPELMFESFKTIYNESLKE